MENIDSIATARLGSVGNEFDSLKETIIDTDYNFSLASLDSTYYMKNVQQSVKNGCNSASLYIGELSDSVKQGFSEETWTSDGMSKGISNTLESAIEAFKQKWNAFADEANNKLSLSIVADGLLAGIEATAPAMKVKIPAFADGGFPNKGDLFLANEAGPEYVASFGNKTAVANDNQIVSGIESGVERAVGRILAPYLSQIADNTRATANKDLTVNIGDRDIARANKRGQRSLGMTIISQT